MTSLYLVSPQTGSSPMDALLSPTAVPDVVPEQQFHSSQTSLFTNQPGDRSSLHLNLAPLDEILKEPPTFLSFKGGSQQSTPSAGISKSQQQTPLRISPPNNILHTPTLHTPTVAQSPTVLLLQTAATNLPTPTTTQASSRASSVGTSSLRSNLNNATTGSSSQYPPAPPPRWAKSSLSTPNSNGTVTTTLNYAVNQVKEIPLRFLSDGSELVTSGRQDLEVTTPPTALQSGENSSTSGGPSHNVPSSLNSFMESCPHSVTSADNFIANGTAMLRHRDNLDLRIRQNFMSPQSTPCTPCNPTTPISTPMSEEGGVNRAKLRKSHRDRRRHSNHYHDVDVIENSQCYRSSLADKVSDYEDVWSSPPRDLDSSSKENSSPKKIPRRMSTFKPSNDISKSLGDLSDISQNKAAIFTYDAESIHDKRIEELNGNSFDSIPFRCTNSPFYVEPADCLRENENRARIKKTPSNKILSRKIANRYSDSNIQWRSRHNRNCMSKIESSDNMTILSSSAENLMNGLNNDKDLNVCGGRRYPCSSKPGHNRNLPHRASRGKPVLPPRISQDSLGADGDQCRPPWRLDASWRYQSCDNNIADAGRRSPPNSGSPSSDARFPILVNIGESESVAIPGEKTVVDLITEKLPNLPVPADTQSIAHSAATKVSEYDNVAIRNNASRYNNNNNEQHNNNTGNIDNKVTPQGMCLSSSISDSGTEFSEPWDSRKWDSLLHTDDESSIEPISLAGTPARPQLEEWDRRLNGVYLQQQQQLTNYGESGPGSDDDVSSMSGSPMFALVQSGPIDSTIKSKIRECFMPFNIHIYFYYLMKSVLVRIPRGKFVSIVCMVNYHPLH